MKQEPNSEKTTPPRRAPARKKPKNFPVIGIGASAGGLEAFHRFFDKMPEDTGMAFILIQHIEPSHVGQVTNIIQQYTSMPVVEVKKDLPVEPNHLYMIPQNRLISIKDGTLKLGEETEGRSLHSIDLFFRSLADDLGDRSICIILSGTGTDGTSGARAVKANAGLVVVQEPSDADYEGMPRSAIEAGVADLVLSAKDMAAKLVDYVRNAYGRPALRRSKSLESAGESFQRMFNIVKAKTRRDFSGYKLSTIRRRIERRMNINKIDRLPDYVRLLEDNPEEVRDLARDFLIQVTSFFRDPQAFTALKRHLKRLIATFPKSRLFRAWVAGCSTGEEAYSLAIVIHECLSELGRPEDFQVFASDLDLHGIEIARAGIYPQSIETDLSKRRLERYFIRQDSRYQIVKELRENITFAVHDLIMDPPFSRLDMVSVRNLLIYLDSETQKKILPVLHYALRDQGILFLGSAETIGESNTERFQALDRKWRIYRAVNREEPPAASDLITGLGTQRTGVVPAEGDHDGAEPGLVAPALRGLLQALPPAVLVDGNLNVLYVHGDTGKYLRLSPDKPSPNLLDLARDGLRVALAGATTAALNGEQTAVREGVRLQNNGESTRVRITVKTVLERDFQLAVVFEDVPEPPDDGNKARPDDENARVKAVEQELHLTRETLRSTVEELETANEELRSTVEEYQSTNEELHSTNEELETSREELQSMNEELNIVNLAHQKKIDELTGLSDDMANLLTSSKIAAIFLDEDLRIKDFTPATVNLLNILERDLGRAITDITSNLPSVDIGAISKTVLDTLIPVEQEVQTNRGYWFTMRISPYRSSENAIMGVVASFTDIDSQKMLQGEYHAALAFTNAILDTMREAIVILDGDLRVISVNHAFHDVFKLDSRVVGDLIYKMGGGEWDIPELRRLLEEILPQNGQIKDYPIRKDFRGVGRLNLNLNARRLEEDQPEKEKILLAIEEQPAVNR